MVTLKRLITAMVTPFDDTGKVNYQRTQKLALALLDSGSDGILVSGTTGESPTLTRDEKLKLFAEIKSAIGVRGAVIAGTGSYNTAATCELTRAAEQVGVDAILLVVPYYNKPTQEGLYQHFKAITSCTKLPCILYNVPSRTAINMTADTVIRLSKIDNVVGIKEASGNLNQIATIIDGTGDDFLVYSGNDGDTLHILTMGGFGVVSVASHLVGRQIANMIEKSISGETQEAATIHRHLLPLINSLFVVSNPSPLKYVLNHIGFPVGKPRLPLVEPDENSALFIESTLKDYHIDLPVKTT